jgi:tetratricopeptide (TPR) repeat protein
MRTLAALLALTLPVMAETGPPTVDEVTRAKAACAAEVQQDCLFILAVDAVLASTDPDEVQSRLNHIATIQAIEGHVAGADRTLSLTKPDAIPLLALGRVDEARTALQREFADLEAKYDTQVEGPLDTFLLIRMLLVDRPELALSSQLYVSNKGKIEQINPLPAVFSHYLAHGRAADAASIFNRLDKSDDDMGERLLALVKALSDAGDLAQAAAFVSGFPDPKAQAQARVLLAKAYLASGLAIEAKAELDQILASVSGESEYPYWTVEVLVQSADVALQSGETSIARQHANAAFKSYDQLRRRRLSQDFGEQDLRTLLRLAAVLDRVGSTGKASAILAKASQPVVSDLFGPKDLFWHFDALYVTQVRIGDQDGAEAMLQKLLEVGRSTSLALTPAALELVELGFLSEARQIGRLIVTQARSGETGASQNLADAYTIYAAILAKDPKLAPEVLQEDLGAWLHFKLSLDRARALDVAGQKTEAGALFADLVMDQQGQSQRGSEPPDLTVCALPAIAREQAKLGFDKSAAITRQSSVASAMATSDGILRSDHLIALAASFRKVKPATVDLVLKCLEYPT